MSSFFRRAARLTFGPKNEDLKRSVQNLMMEFDLEFTSESTPNKASIGVWNMNDDSRSILHQQDKDILVQLDVGYLGRNLGLVGNQVNENGEDPLETLFIGGISKKGGQRVSSVKEKNEWVTRIEAKDGIEDLTNTIIRKVFPAKTDTTTIINFLAEQAESALGVIKGIGVKVFEQGVTISGAFKDEMDKYALEAGVEWSIQDGTINILPQNQATQDLGFLLTPDTGLIGSPTVREEGIEFQSLMIPSLKPGRQVQIQSRQFDGVFKIRKSNFKGNTRKSDFRVICEATELPTGSFLDAGTTFIPGVIA